MSNHTKIYIRLLCFFTVVCLHANAMAQINKTFTEPKVSSEIAAGDSGIVKQIHVQEGDTVRAGDIIAELDREVMQKSLLISKERAKSNSRIKSAKAILNLRKEQLGKLMELRNNGAANPYEVSKAESEYNAALAELEFAQEEKHSAALEVQRIEAQLETRVIRAPMNGVIVELHRELGEYVSVNEPAIATLVQLEQLKARFYLLEDEVKTLHNGDAVKIAIGRNKTDAQVVFVSPIIDPDSRTARVDVLIDNHNQEFTSGRSCEWPN